MSMDGNRAEEIGREIVQNISSKKIPFVEDAILDDFNPHSGQIYVNLEMETSSVGIYKPIYRFKNNEQPLRSISNQLHSVCKKFKNDSKAECYNWEVPKPVYDDQGFRRVFMGYDNNFIFFDYDVY